MREAHSYVNTYNAATDPYGNLYSHFNTDSYSNINYNSYRDSYRNSDTNSYSHPNALPCDQRSLWRCYYWDCAD